MKENYSLFTEAIIEKSKKTGTRPTLLLHVCCAPCSSYVLEYLSDFFDITIFFYNPNISPENEYTARLNELKKFTEHAGYNSLSIEIPKYDQSEFFDNVKGMEKLPERSERCRVCYELRMRRSASAARDGKFDYFTTTLSISPHKNAEWLNEIGRKLENEYGVSYLYSDFKKKNGYKRSIELSEQYGLYRQDYCGCIYSKIEAEKRRSES